MVYIPIVYRPKLSLYRFQLSPIAAFRAVYICSKSILSGPARPNLIFEGNVPFIALEDIVGVNGPPPSESVRDRLVIV
jgi:hypothetical protein